MPCCDTGRNIQKYKGGGASTLQDALENGNTASLNINLSSPAIFIGDGGGLSNINASAVAGNLQAVTDNGATTTNKIIITNGATSLETSGNIVVSTNVYATEFYGDGGTLSNIAANKNFQEVTDIGATTSNKITLTNSVTSLETSGNVSITGNVTASKFYGDGTTLTGVALSTDLASNSTRIGNLETNLTNNSTRITTVTNNLTNNVIRIGNLETNLTNNSSRIGNLETNLTNNSTRITTVTNNLTNNVIRIGNLETNLTNNSSRITTVTNNLTNNVIRIGNLETNLTNNSSRIGTLETDMTSNASRINTLETEIQPVNRGGTNITTYAIGDILIASATDTLSKLSLGTGGYVLTSNSTSGLPEWKSSSDLGTEVAQLSNGSYILGGAYNGITPEEWSVQASTSNTADYIVARDSSGDIFVSNVNAINIRGDGSGITNSNASNISLGTLAVARGGTGTTTSTGSGSVVLNTSPTFSGTVQGGTFSGSGSGLTSLNAGNISTGTLPVARGGTGATTLNNLIQMGTHTTGNYVATITGGNGIESTGATSGESITHTLSVDTKANGGLVIQNNQLAVDLSASAITGTLAVSDGGTNITSYAKGDILIASATNTLSNLSLGTSGYVLTSNSTSGLPEWRSASDIGTTVATLNTGNYLTGGPYNGSSTITFNVEGTTTNTPSNLVARDSSGDIYVQRVIVGTGSTGTLSSSAWSGSAAKLTTPRTIGGVSFDGSTNINLPGVNTTGNQNTTGSAAKLTTPRTIGGVSFDGSTNINLPGVNTTGNQNTTGSAAKLTTPRTIGGVSFDGSADINLPGVNTIGNQNTTGSAAKISVTNSTSSSQLPLPFMSAANGDVTLYSDSGALQYQASTGTLSSTQFNGSGTSLTGLNATNINNGTLSNAYGGTGFTSYNQGDLLVGTGSGSKLKKLSKGDANYVLTVNSLGNDIEWAAAYSSIWTQSDNDIYYDGGNVGIANTAPIHTLDVGSNVAIIDDGIDKLVIRGNVYSTNDIIASSFEGNGSKLTGVIASSITTEASRTISISTVNVLGAEWRRT
jgi:hypothetical protein